MAIKTNLRTFDANFSDFLVQGCQTRGLLEATLHDGNRDEGRMMFSIWRSPLLRATVSVM